MAKKPELKKAADPTPEISINAIKGPDVEPPEDYKSQAEVELYGDAKRDEERKQEGHRVFIWLLRIAAVLVGMMLFVRILHFILPANTFENKDRWPHGWLTDSQLDGIDTYFLSATIGALMLRYARSVLPADKKQDP